MKQLFKSTLILGLFLLISFLLSPSPVFAQTSNEVHNITVDKNTVNAFDLGTTNWAQYGITAESNEDGGMTLHLQDSAQQQEWLNYLTGNGEQPKQRYLILPNQEVGGLSNTTGTNPASSTTTPTSTSQNEGNSAPDVTDAMKNMINNEIAGLEVEIPSASDILSGGNATGSGNSGGGLTGVCASAENVFKQIACKAMMFLIDLRVLAYIISGFGMVMFAWAAIFNKISWKHFSQIAIGLFMLSMIGPFITYFTGYEDIEKNLEYGNYLGGKYQPVLGSTDNVQCSDGSTNCTPNTDTKNKTINQTWSLKDLKGSIQSGLNLVRSGYNAYQTAKNTYNSVKSEAQAIGNAIKNSGGGLDGILDAASQVAGAANRLSFDVKTGVGGIASQVGNAANAAQDIAATNEQREDRQNTRVNGDEHGNKTTNAVSEWLSASGSGGQALDQLNKVSNTVSSAATGVGKATTAGHEGQKIGGGGGFGEVVGGIFAAGTAVGEGVGMYSDEQQKKLAEQQRLQQANAKATSIMENAANTQSATVNNSLALVSQQNAINSAVDKAVNNQISSKSASVTTALGNSGSTATTQSSGNTLSNATQAANEQLKEQEASNQAQTQAATAASSGTPASNQPAASSSAGQSAVNMQQASTVGAAATQVANQQLQEKETAAQNNELSYAEKVEKRWDTRSRNWEVSSSYNMNDGEQVTEYSNGAKEVKIGDGREMKITPDGNINYIHHGTEFHAMDDGTVVATDQDGETTYYSPDSVIAKQMEEMKNKYTQ